MWASKLANRLSKAIYPASRWSIIFGTVALFVLLVVVVVDVTLRSAISLPIPGNIEIIGTTLVIVFFAGYAYAEMKGQHIQVSAITSRFSERVQHIVTTNGYVLIFAVAGLIAWQYYAQAMFEKFCDVVTRSLHMPTWPVLVVACALLALFAIAALISFLKSLGGMLTIIKGIQGYLWLLPGIVLGFILFAVVTGTPNLFVFELSKGAWAIILVAVLFTLIFLKVHIGISMALTALIGISYIAGSEAGLADLAIAPLHIARKYTWSVMPLFIWMGLLAHYAGFAKELYDTAYKWIGHLWGGLASATAAACAGLAAITGSTMTGVLTMGVLALPEMKKYKYDMKLATATICTASTIGSLIPPSIDFIIYGMLTEVSIGKLFIAGILPGIMFTGILITMITIQCRLNPKLGPRGSVTPWKERIISIKDVWAVALLILIVLGGLYGGFFTPTEAGAIGAFGALVIGFARRRLKLKGLFESGIEAVRMTGVIMFIFLFAIAFTTFLTLTEVPNDVATWVIGLDLSPYAILSVILFIYLILGCIMPAVPAVILTLPIFFQIAMACGFDRVWFGLLIIVMCELAQITPPIGMNVFAMSAIAPDIPMYSIFKGVLPFWGAFLIQVAILVAFPQICLFLPSLMG